MIRKQEIMDFSQEVTSIMEELYGFELTSSQVSQAAKLLNEELALWRSRPLGCFRYVYLDVLYEKVRYAGQVRCRSFNCNGH